MKWFKQAIAMFTSLWISPDHKEHKLSGDETHVDWVIKNSEMLKTKYGIDSAKFIGRTGPIGEIEEEVKAVLFKAGWIRLAMYKQNEIDVEAHNISDVKNLAEDALYKYKPKEIYIDTEVEGSFYLTLDLFFVDGWEAIEKLGSIGNIKMKWFKISSELSDEQRLEQADKFIQYRNKRIKEDSTVSEKTIWLMWYQSKDFDPEDLDEIKERIGERILDWEDQI